jgi:beta-carotene ketolase (CrtW type)
MPLTIMALWAGSLIWLFSVDVSSLGVAGLIAAVFLRTFLQTGLFITAHDAMHGTIVPSNRQLNDRIGAISILAYALLPYRSLLKKHRMHHRYPASSRDPDFCERYQHQALLWYFQFMAGYLDPRQLRRLLTGMGLMLILFNLGWQIPLSNLLLFWILPLLLSSIQLFYFGTFLPHRQTEIGYSDRHRAKSSRYPVFWSLITCYHFGYHWEHHVYPHLPWYQLPAVNRAALSQQS